MIVSLQLRPGSLVDEGRLEEELTIGRTPIREAVLRLAAEALVEAVPGRGHIVSAMGLNDVKALFEAMMISERAMAVLAARRRTRDHLTELAELSSRIAAAMAGNDFLAVTLLNSRFHRVIYRAGRNAFLQSSLDHIQSQAQRLAYLCFSQEVAAHDLEEHYRKVQKDHETIIRRLEKRDQEGLIQAVTGHIRLFHDRVARYTRPDLEGLEAMTVTVTEAA
jgi:DNA-binding GntR family transcriptional regulator